MEFTAWLGPMIAAAAAVVAAGIAAWIGAANRRALAQFERRANIDTQLSDKRRELYTAVLKPFLIAITPDVVWNTDPRTKGKNKQQVMEQAMLNMSYRETMFQLTFVGSDEVARAFNDLMQHFYRAGPNPQDRAEHGKEMAKLLATLLLAIRRGAGNDTTKLDKWAMLEPFMKDAREQRDAERRGL